MDTLADRTIARLRAEHDLLAGLVSSLGERDLSDLTGPSAATEWSVAEVLSHLGSGAEISMAGLRAALGETAAPAPDFNQGVWDRWNAMPPREQASESVAGNAELVARFEGLDAEQRAQLQFNLGFLPAPIPTASFAGMRLNEFVLHSWDIRVAYDRHATLPEESAAVLLEQFAGGLAFLLGFIGKPPADAAPIRFAIPSSPYSVAIDGAVSLTAEPGPSTATFSGSPETVIRLMSGRLTAAYTPAHLTVEGNTTLDALRAMFPGF